MAKEFTSLRNLELNIYTMIPRLKIASEKPRIENPFKSNLRLSTWDIVRIPLCFILVVVRLAALGLTITMAVIFGHLFLIGYQETSPPERLVGFRKIGRHLISICCRICAFSCGFHYIKVKGELDPSARILVAAPHSSFIDIFTIMLVGTHCAVTRHENILNPLLGNCVRLLEPSSVSRDQKDSKAKVVKEIKRRANSKDWPPTLLFAEGTCTNRKAFIFFKPGAFYPGLPVQPVIIRYPDDLDYATWTWVGPGFFPLLIVMMSRLNNNVELEILPIYRPTEEEIKDPILYARNVRNYVAKVDGAPITDHSYEDCRLMSEAQRLKMPMEAGLVEYYKLSSILGMNCDAMIVHLQQFAQIDRNSDGIIDVDEFSEYLHLPPNDEVKTIFRIYNTSKTNAINFREYLVGSCMISKAFIDEKNNRQAFEMLDTLQNGYITLEDIAAFTKDDTDQGKKRNIRIFNDMNKQLSGKVDYAEFNEFLHRKPEYALLLMHFRKQVTRSDTSAEEAMQCS